MLRNLFCTAIVGAIVVSSDVAGAQIVGPARRAASDAAAAAGAPGVGARIQNREAARGITPGDRWRYVNHGNQWWYYTPQSSWMMYRNNAWAPYDAASYTGSVPGAPMVPAGFGTNNAHNWRYVYNGNRWWYYTPQQSWTYFDNNRWSPYQAGAAGTEYRTGYRGTRRAYSNVPGNPPQVPVDPNLRDGRGAAATERPDLNAAQQANPPQVVPTQPAPSQAAPVQAVPPQANPNPGPSLPARPALPAERPNP
ncbi:MAG TPA: hypothetical protein VGN12_21035 [Pirellulales bacterium]|jgi:hypothetical protein